MEGKITLVAPGTTGAAVRKGGETEYPVGFAVAKTYKGVSFSVSVKSPFAFTVEANGKQIGCYRSLTAAAQAIVGNAKAISGPAFFGLTESAPRKLSAVLLAASERLTAEGFTAEAKTVSAVAETVAKAESR